MGSVRDTRTIKAHIVNTTGRTLEDMPYLALSHCWGKKSHAAAMTTNGNLKARAISLPVSHLPKTILDAILITRQLGFRYLWIDTLCVIQDSIEDWETACATMAAIYANSACTIAASASEDDEAGCFVPRDPQAIGWIGIDFPYPIPSDYNLVSNRIICNQEWPVPITSVARRVILHPNVPEPRSSVETGPLFQRGWALQERCLSPRMLHFTEQQVAWECESTWSYESLHLRDQVFVDTDMCLSKHKSDTHALEEPAHLYEAWYSIVREFSRAHLTRITDQLPALSGMAKAYLGKLPQDTYLAGLWKHDLVRGLWWAKNSDYAQALQRPNTYLAPSWSWASVRGPIFHPEIGSFVDGPRIVHCEVKVAGLDPLGQVRDGVLEINGCLKVVRRGHQILPGFSLPPPRALIKLPKPYTPDDVTNLEERLSDRYRLIDRDMEDELAPVGQIYFDDAKDSSEQYLYCLRMAKPALQRYSTIHVLAFVPTGNVLEQYRRVGIGEIIRANWFDNSHTRTFKII